MRNCFLFNLLIICLLLGSCGEGDIHPDYPYTFIDSVHINHVKPENLEEDPLDGYTPIMVKNRMLYLQDSCFYDIRGNLIKTFSIERMFPDDKLYLTAKRTAKGYYPLHKAGRFDNDFYLFDFDNDRLVREVLAIDFKSYMKHELTDESEQRLAAAQFWLPAIPTLPGHKGYNSEEYKDVRKKYEQQLKDNYNKAVLDFAAKNKNEVYLYSSKMYQPTLVFPEKGLSFIMESEVEGFPDFAEYVKPKKKSENPPISFRKTETAFLGYTTHRSFGIPFPEKRGYIHYFELICDDKTFNFKANFDLGEELYDYEETDDKIYFAMSSFTTIIRLYEYNRKVE